MCEGPYIVHVHDPGSAPPNLARVQEIAAGIWRINSGVFIDQAELWVDDIRLGDVVRETGAAGAIDLAIAAADVADLSLALSRRDGQFRQLTEDPSYVTNTLRTSAGRCGSIASCRSVGTLRPGDIPAHAGGERAVLSEIRPTCVPTR